MQRKFMYPWLYDALQLFSRSRSSTATAAATRSDTAKTFSNGAVCMGDVLSFFFFLTRRRFVMLMLYSSYISVMQRPLFHHRVVLTRHESD